MEMMHNLLPEDEILLCGALLLYGCVLGAAARLVTAWRERRTA
jgi:hypothetical protein